MGDGRVIATPAIELDDLTVAYGRHTALRQVSGRFEPGSLTAIVGPNGAGKSTLLKALAGMLKPLRGQIRPAGMERRQALAYLPQIADIDRSFPITVADTVAAGAWRQIGAWGGVTPAVRRKMAEALATVGLEGFEQRSMDSLSGGQFQRVLFARLLLQALPVMLLDEPFHAMDARTTHDLLALLQRWHAEGRTVIVALHDLAMVRRCFPQTLLLAREAIAWGRTAEVLQDRNQLAMQRTAEGWNMEDASDHRLAG